MTDRNYTHKIYVSEESFNRIQDECKEEYIRNHPEFADIPMSNGFIVKKMVDWWLKVGFI